MFKTFITFAFAISFPMSLAAQDRLSIVVDDSFEDMMFAVESSIIDQGLVIDSISHVGNMLNRTADDVGATENIYHDASVFNFCSSILTREVIAIDPTNIAYCPYSVYVFTTQKEPDKTTIGVPIYLYPEMDGVNDLLRDIIINASKF